VLCFEVHCAHSAFLFVCSKVFEGISVVAVKRRGKKFELLFSLVNLRGIQVFFKAKIIQFK